MASCTVVIPCFNRADLLVETLASLIGQTFRDWEAVIVDDASTEGGLEDAVRGFRDTRLTYLRHDRNLGPGVARNTGIRHGVGDLIFTLDSDDLLEERCLEQLVGVMRAEPGVDCVYPDLALFGSTSGVLHYGVGDDRAMVRAQWLPGPGCLYRRSLWERVGGYCEDASLRYGNEDWDFYLTAVEVGLRVRHVPQPLYRYRVGLASTGTRLQYYNHLTRELIYTRHRPLFDRYSAGRAFRAEGYLASAWASLAAGERRRGLRLALRAWLLNPRSPSAVVVMVASLVPRATLPAARMIRDLVRRGGRPSRIG
jgi:glycosyltransferase involved in cell wall biosynthesis